MGFFVFGIYSYWKYFGNQSYFVFQKYNRCEESFLDEYLKLNLLIIGHDFSLWAFWNSSSHSRECVFQRFQMNFQWNFFSKYLQHSLPPLFSSQLKLAQTSIGNKGSGSGGKIYIKTRRLKIVKLRVGKIELRVGKFSSELEKIISKIMRHRGR